VDAKKEKSLGGVSCDVEEKYNLKVNRHPEDQRSKKKRRR